MSGETTAFEQAMRRKLAEAQEPLDQMAILVPSFLETQEALEKLTYSARETGLVISTSILAEIDKIVHINVKDYVHKLTTRQQYSKSSTKSEKYDELCKKVLETNGNKEMTIKQLEVEIARLTRKKPGQNSVYQALNRHEEVFEARKQGKTALYRLKATTTA